MSEIHTIMVEADHGEYSYHFVPHAKPIIRGGKTPEESVANMRTFVRGNYTTMLRRVTGDTLSSSDTARGYLTSLKGLGYLLYKAIPKKLTDAVDRDMKRGDFLHIYADELISIPWELVKNGGDFWGEMYVISNSAADGEERVDPDPLRLKIRKVLNVIGHGIPEDVASRARQLFEDLHVQLSVIDGTDNGTLAEFYEQLPTADLIHFTGHGAVGSNGPYLRIVEAEDESENFMVAAIVPGSLQPGCIVFANACQSSEKTAVLCELIGFGPKFCAGGASAFIGTLDRIHNGTAVQCAEKFYRQLFSGDEIGKALLAAKQVPFKGEDIISLAPLLYSLYGNPLVTVELPEQPGS